MNFHTRLAVTCLGLSLVFAPLNGCGGDEQDKTEQSQATQNTGSADPNAVSGLFESDNQTATPPNMEHAGTPDTTGGVDSINPDATKVSFLGLTGPRAETWEQFPAASEMRAANYRVTGSGGEAEVVVFHFPGVGGGPRQMNIDRWVRQFSTDGDGPVEPNVTEFEANGMPITLVELNGTYQGMGPTGQVSAKPNQRFLGAIIENTRIGNVYIRLVGPNVTVLENKDAFMNLLQNLKPVG